MVRDAHNSHPRITILVYNTGERPHCCVTHEGAHVFKLDPGIEVPVAYTSDEFA
jgi:hypothetical protein